MCYTPNPTFVWRRTPSSPWKYGHHLGSAMTEVISWAADGFIDLRETMVNRETVDGAAPGGTSRTFISFRYSL